jgi:predicted nucleotidyltransferase
MEDYLKTIRDYLRTQPVKKAYLFGSYARGEQDEVSDIDLMVELDDRVGLYKFVGIQIKLEELLSKKVDLITTEGISPRLKPYIDKDKLLVYER